MAKRYTNDTQMSAAGVKIEEAKVRKCQLNSTQPFLWPLMTCQRTGNWDMITKDEITWALPWEVMIV
jgi:hypothetical protein